MGGSSGGYSGGYNPQGTNSNWMQGTQNYGQPPMGGNYGANTYQPQSYGQPQAQNNSMQPQTQPAGGGWNPQSGAGGYNPQPMNGSTYSPGPPGWDMRAGAGGQPYMQAGMGQLTEGAPDWLKLQMGQYMDFPNIADPNTRGRWNWGTNMQGNGIPSPFGQYAQQNAQYNPIQFPPPPQPPGNPPPGGPPGPPTPPPGPPTPPPQPPNTSNFDKLSDSQLVQLRSAIGNNGQQAADLRKYMTQRFGDDQGIGNAVQKWSAGGSAWSGAQPGQGEGYANGGTPYWLDGNSLFNRAQLASRNGPVDLNALLAGSK